MAGTTHGLERLLQALAAYYSVPLQVPMRQFRNGVIYFAVGLMSIFMANTYMPPSWQQEAVVLFGLALGAVGFIMALLAEMRMLISRILAFTRRKY